MNKIKKAAIGAALAIGVVAGGTALAAPAQADWGTDVHLQQISGKVPVNVNGWIKARNMNGNDKILHLGETAHNNAKFCPPGTNWAMWVTGPAGTSRFVSAGLCYVPTNDGTYNVELVDLT